MRLTTKSRYGTRAIFDIAYNSAGMPLQIKDISKRQEIPPRYLEQIFHKLKGANIINSVRGPGGGYVLARDPSKITVGDIVKAMKEPIDPVFCVEDENEEEGLTKEFSSRELHRGMVKNSTVKKLQMVRFIICMLSLRHIKTSHLIQKLSL